MSRIISIGTAVPEYSTRQESILHFMQKAYADDTASRKLNILFRSSGIGYRHSVLPDFDPDLGRNTLFNGTGVPGIKERLDVFKQKSVGLAEAAIKNSLKKINASIHQFGITHLITVTCTGLHSPGLGAALIKRLGLHKNTFHTAVNFMGCNAAFPAMKIADMIAKTEKDAKVMVVCAELCTLHFQPVNDLDHLLSNTLFGDGAAALIMVPDEYADKNNLKGFSVNGFYSGILDEGEALMGWNINALNFGMILDAGVPSFIGEKIEEMVSGASEKLIFTIGQIGKWAVHPGGRKILDVIKKVLSLNDHQLTYSYRVLHDFGNMSSPTILFVLNEIMKDGLKKDEKILSVGFGPGISMDTSLFTYAG